MNDEIKFDINGYLFTWDNDKARANIRKHRVSFEVAAEAILDPYAVKMRDDLHSIDEDRYKIIGRILKKELILSVIYVERVRQDNIELFRIISARDATRKEKELYGVGLSGGLPSEQRRSNRTRNERERGRY